MFCTLPRLPTRSTNVPSRPLLHHIVKLNKQLALLASYSIPEWKAKTQPGRTLDCFYCFPRQSNWHTLGTYPREQLLWNFIFSTCIRTFKSWKYKRNSERHDKKNPKRMSSSYYLGRLPIHYVHRSLHIRTDQTVSCLLIQFSSERHAEIQNLSKSVNMWWHTKTTWPLRSKPRCVS